MEPRDEGDVASHPRGSLPPARLSGASFHGTRAISVLYLDFDGVLHPEAVYWHPRHGAYLAKEFSSHRLFEHAELLANLLRPFPDVKIVLSTSWVRQYRFSRTAKFLPCDLRRRCIGATFHTRMDRPTFEEMPRGAQVLADAARRQPLTWIALDDTTEGWQLKEERIGRVVLTDPVDGIAHRRVLPLLETTLEESFGSR